MMDRISLAGRMLELFARRAYGTERTFELTPEQWSILRLVAGQTKKACAVRFIASYLGGSLQEILRAVSILHGKSLVSVDVPSSSGASTVSLTEKGAVLLTQDPILFVEQAIARLSPGEETELAGLLDKLLDTPARPFSGESS